ncbi:hypothetical protein TBK1r_50590 [Stieleria magnilauensis]|uniref:Uncharacterized protein n=1 Tax=Stieleria magnilauensis TaxID=2527963 RepID=A0ABX5XWV6_9BACT|nr:hypothetical protein TBK1r_50590 [Planctomycetes bacterium TBK1r]
MKYSLLFSLLAVAIAGFAIRTGSWSWILLYPAFSFGMVGASYLLSMPGIFGKQPNGSRSAGVMLGWLWKLSPVHWMALKARWSTRSRS